MENAINQIGTDNRPLVVWIHFCCRNGSDNQLQMASSLRLCRILVKLDSDPAKRLEQRKRETFIFCHLHAFSYASIWTIVFRAQKGAKKNYSNNMAWARCLCLFILAMSKLCQHFNNGTLSSVLLAKEVSDTRQWRAALYLRGHIWPGKFSDVKVIPHWLHLASLIPV